MASPQGSMSLPPRHDTFARIFFKHQLWPNSKPPLGSISVAGQTAVITGGNTGLGLECGKILLGCHLSHLVLTARSTQKGEAAAAHLRTLYPLAKIEVWQLDMNSYESILAFARKCQTLDRLDIAILSAGIMNMAYRANPFTGHEETFQVNYLSTALLAILLLPLLKSKTPHGAPGRLTLVASGAALIAEFSERNNKSLIGAFDTSEGWNSSTAKKRYDTTKGLVLMLTYKLSTITKEEDTVVNVVDPSFTPGTSFFRDLPLLTRVMTWPLVMLVGTSVNKAAWMYVNAAVGRGRETHGSFLSDWEINPFHNFMYTDDGHKFMDRLWKETLQELDFPEVHEALATTGEKPAM